MHATLAKVIEGRVELLALRYAADLLGEDLGAAGGLDVSTLSIEAGDLVEQAGCLRRRLP